MDKCHFQVTVYITFKHNFSIHLAINAAANVLQKVSMVPRVVPQVLDSAAVVFYWLPLPCAMPPSLLGVEMTFPPAAHGTPPHIHAAVCSHPLWRSVNTKCFWLQNPEEGEVINSLIQVITLNARCDLLTKHKLSPNKCYGNAVNSTFTIGTWEIQNWNSYTVSNVALNFSLIFIHQTSEDVFSQLGKSGKLHITSSKEIQSLFFRVWR